MPTTRRDDPTSDLQAAYARSAAGLFRYALMLTANHAEAEDAVQQVFTAVATRGTAGIGSLDHYLRTSIRNECYSRLTRRRAESLEDGRPLLEVVASGEVDNDDRLALEQGIRDLPPDQREVVHLKVFEGLTFREVADLTGESINTIASRYRYAVQKLRTAFGVETPT